MPDGVAARLWNVSYLSTGYFYSYDSHKKPYGTHIWQAHFSRRDQCHAREIGVIASAVARQQRQPTYRGVFADKKIRKDSGSCPARPRSAIISTRSPTNVCFPTDESDRVIR